ncbi:MAG: hypothetical protein JO171_19090 [Paludibacterium sp.]|uniref:hypothetical protein n=1 Tax=Paludibacterium sp. TaxID=1917523 RepID=UPI0025F0720D|nr:hypothetical protein [Paludibacterium sp.]MBV8049262.1 hypothetical protein [Paludibacterium sp.]MBV8648276.1 hypothetical protein [Paludibacterium sp.]
MKALPTRVGMLLLASMLSACASYKATLLPQENDTYTAISTSSNYRDALNDAVGKANDHCDSTRRKAVFLERAEVSKQDEQGDAVKVTNTVASAAVKIMTFGIVSSNFGQSDEDHKVAVRFRCE